MSVHLHLSSLLYSQRRVVQSPNDLYRTPILCWTLGHEDEEDSLPGLKELHCQAGATGEESHSHRPTDLRQHRELEEGLPGRGQRQSRLDADPPEPREAQSFQQGSSGPRPL